MDAIAENIVEYIPSESILSEFGFKITGSKLGIASRQKDKVKYFLSYSDSAISIWDQCAATSRQHVRAIVVYNDAEFRFVMSRVAFEKFAKL